MKQDPPAHDLELLRALLVAHGPAFMLRLIASMCEDEERTCSTAGNPEWFTDIWLNFWRASATAANRAASEIEESSRADAALTNEGEDVVVLAFDIEAPT